MDQKPDLYISPLSETFYQLYGQPLDDGQLYGQPLDDGHMYGQPLDDGHLYGQNLDDGHLYGQPLDDGHLYGQPLDDDQLYGKSLDDGHLYGQPLDDDQLYGKSLDDDQLYGKSLDDGQLYGKSLHDGQLNGQNLHDGPLYGHNLDDGPLFDQPPNHGRYETRLWRRTGEKRSSQKGEEGPSEGQADEDEGSGSSTEDTMEDSWKSSQSSEAGKDPRFAFDIRNIARAVIVRTLLIAHVVIAVWRVTVVYDDHSYWTVLFALAPMGIEGVIIIVLRNGIEYKWWCPCLLTYLCTIHPLMWVLQLDQYHAKMAELATPSPLPPSSMYARAPPAPRNQSATLEAILSSTGTSLTNLTDVANGTAQTPITMANQEQSHVQGDELWLIILEESLMYLIVLSRWFLPRGLSVSREFLADLLLEFLAMASDIMELLAVFDEPAVRINLNLNYAIMALWSASFIQFIPLLAHKRKYLRIKSPNIRFITRCCGDNFAEIVLTCMNIFLQDGPFLALRLYIIISLRFMTYSLAFFVLKNVVTLVLLSYRLFLLFYRLP